MNKLWTYIENKEWQAETKYKAVLFLLGVCFAAIGYAAWLIIRIWALSGWDWMLCFIGFPVIFSWFFVFFYSCRHDFHDGIPES